ncbi:hypothetical protein DUI87_22496 [Hirundo rustica rustica]|uniref:Uncharacterized protein n=1 Tax=Hirundo rustica rustica TaxID=333673 RepID=A0A3M0JI88_HIRRU|nr:hypothetical protein DUI87_22496 [Hirundo rustica rustica]
MPSLGKTWLELHLPASGSGQGDSRLFHQEKLGGQDHNYNRTKDDQVRTQPRSQVLGPYRVQLDSVLWSDGLGDPGEAKI